MKATVKGVSCTCLTKTPELRYHKEGCKYRMFMDKEDWINQANKYLVSLTGEWDNPEDSREYCECLYETYVEEQETDDLKFSPKDAVDEDMTYWD